MSDIGEYAALAGDDLGDGSEELREKIGECFGRLKWLTLEKAKTFAQLEKLVKGSEWESVVSVAQKLDHAEPLAVKIPPTPRKRKATDEGEKDDTGTAPEDDKSKKDEEEYVAKSQQETPRVTYRWEGSKRFCLCTLCGFEKGSANAIKGHIRREHTHEWLNCEKCGFKTQNDDSLSKHKCSSRPKRARRQ